MATMPFQRYGNQRTQPQHPQAARPATPGTSKAGEGAGPQRRQVGGALPPPTPIPGMDDGTGTGADQLFQQLIELVGQEPEPPTMDSNSLALQALRRRGLSRRQPGQAAPQPRVSTDTTFEVK